MHVLVATSNRYVHLLPAFAWCLERFWPAHPTVGVLHYDVLPEPIRGRYVFLSGGQQDRVSWSGGLRGVVAALPPEERVLLLLDDYWLSAPVDAERLAELEAWMAASPGVQKLDLSGDRLRFAHDPGPRSDLVAAIAHPAVYDPSGGFKSRLFLASTQAALWRAGFLAELLRDDESAWEFEANGTRRLVGSPRGSILGVRDPLLRYANATKAGKPMLLRESHIPASLLAELRAAGLLAPWGLR